MSDETKVRWFRQVTVSSFEIVEKILKDDDYAVVKKSANGAHCTIVNHEGKEFPVESVSLIGCPLDVADETLYLVRAVFLTWHGNFELYFDERARLYVASTSLGLPSGSMKRTAFLVELAQSPKEVFVAATLVE